MTVFSFSLLTPSPAREIILAAGVMLLGFVLWRALQRPVRRWLAARLALSLIAVTALTLAGLRPAREAAVSGDTVLLLTEGTEAKTIDSLRRELKPEHVLTLDSSLMSTKKGIAGLPDAGLLPLRYPAVRRIHVVGYGLTAAEREPLGGYIEQVHFSEEPGGIVSLSFTPEVAEGEAIEISGWFRQAGGKGQTLVLRGPDAEIVLLDKLRPGRWPFRASLPARAAGRYLLSLITLDENNGRRQQASLPVIVTPPVLPRVFILNQAPGFETKYLKNWLAGQGYPVAVRSTVSRDKYLTEFDNRPPVDLYPLRRGIFREFDLVLLDGPALAGLDAAERALLRAAVTDGLGLCLLVEEEWPGLPAADRAFFLDFPHRGGGPLFTPPGQDTGLPKAPFVLEEGPEIYPLLNARPGQLAAAFRLRGQGRLAVSLLNATYRLLLEGKREAYADLWTPLLERIARPPAPDHEWRLTEPLLLFPHHPIDVTLLSGEREPVVRVGAPDSSLTTVYAAQHPVLADQWSGVFWPQMPGWHTLTTAGADDAPGFFYVQPPGAWASLLQARRLAENQAWLQQQTPENGRETTEISVEKPCPLAWFYIAFLFATGLLWLEERW